MLPRDDDAFLNWVNLWLHQMTLDREFDRLREKWLSAGAEAPSASPLVVGQRSDMTRVAPIGQGLVEAA